MRKLNIKSKVAYFSLYCPKYREGVFSILAKNEQFEFFVYSAENFDGGFQISNKNEVDFNLIYTNVKIFKIPILKKKLFFIPDVIKSIIKKDYSVIILPNRMTELHIWLALILCKLFSVRLILWGHGNFRKKNSFVEKIRTFIMRVSDANIFYIEETAEYYSKIGLPSHKLFVAYNSIDTNKINYITENKISGIVDDKYELKKDKIILFIGRLVERKRLDILLYAFSEFLKLKKDKDWKLVFIGDGPEISNLKILSNQLKIITNVVFVGTVTDEEIIASFMQKVAFGVIPSVAGLMVNHFFSYGIPLIIGDNFETHPPEANLVIDGKTGLYFKDNNVNDLVIKMYLLSSDENLRQQLAVNAKKIIDRKYNVNKMAEGISSAILQIINI